MIGVIAAREWRGLFLSPLAWTLLAVTQALLAWILIILINDFQNMQGRLAGLEHAPGVTDLVVAPLFRVAAWALLLLTPLLTMRLFSEERRAGTLDLLLSAPVSATQIVLGKYLGVLIFLLGVVALTALMPLALMTGAALDGGKLLAGLLGLSLLAASFAAAGLYLSSLTAQPLIAATATFGLLLAFWIVDAVGVGQGIASQFFGYLSLPRHHDALLLGLVRSEDVAYYLLFSAAFLGLTIRRLDNLRLRG
ncbi:MAG TPA: ABC transporter permease subunit [Candidatus Contendobacter sp.]|nr:ABC transporter permease subunit [Candidatus Contendobacter sp.]HRZ22882.1 ABC transporter permease subunit [Candidatus Contendobacter sp.]